MGKRDGFADMAAAAPESSGNKIQDADGTIYQSKFTGGDGNNDDDENPNAMQVKIEADSEDENENQPSNSKKRTSQSPPTPTEEPKRKRPKIALIEKARQKIAAKMKKCS